MKNLFLLLRVTTGMVAVGALGILLAIVLLRSGAQFLKEGASNVGYVAKLFTSAFTQGTTPKAPAGWIVSLPLAGLALLFVAMLVSLFLPGAKMFLHLIAILAGVAVIWFVRMMLTEATLEILSLPLIVFWFLYYAMCLFWRGNQPVSLATGS